MYTHHISGVVYGVKRYLDAVVTTMADSAKTYLRPGIAESACGDNLKRCIHRTDLERFLVHARQ
jgi:hypothetical protein